MMGRGDLKRGTRNSPAAGAAQDEGGIAATIEQDDRLLAARVRLFNGGEQLAGEDFGASLFGEDGAHIYDFGARHRAVSDPVGQMQVAVLPVARVMKRFERGRGRAEHDASPR